jgi:pyruvate kinase
VRRTKIIATLGPSSTTDDVLPAMLASGVDVVRLNFSHGSAAEHTATARRVRALAAAQGRHIAILADLQGPKIRIAGFRDTGAISLVSGAHFTLDLALAPDAGTSSAVGCTYPQLAEDVKPDDILLLDDGLITLKVREVCHPRIDCTVVEGGLLSANKGINKLGGGLSAPALTSKDCADIATIATMDVDYVAVSFPRTAADLVEARHLLRAAGSPAAIIAKMERAEAILPGEVESMIDAADAIMVARGDLGVEIGDAHLPRVQKELIALARARNRAVITATQMMESMIEHPVPTRAEVFDVANAVLDGTDAVMLSAETATGRYPLAVVAAMHRICLDAEQHPSIRHSDHRLHDHFSRIDEAIAMSAMYTANHLDIKAIAALTETGSTPLRMSRISSGIPIFGMSRHRTVCQRMALYRGVYPIFLDASGMSIQAASRLMASALVDSGLMEPDDWALLTQGQQQGIQGTTNMMKIARLLDIMTHEAS